MKMLYANFLFLTFTYSVEYRKTICVLSFDFDQPTHSHNVFPFLYPRQLNHSTVINVASVLLSIVFIGQYRVHHINNWSIINVFPFLTEYLIIVNVS